MREWRKSSYSGDSANDCVEVRWRKSSYSGDSDNDCVEVRWRKSSHSGGSANDCVEVAFMNDLVDVRDSKNASGPALAFPPSAWRAFAHNVQ